MTAELLALAARAADAYARVKGPWSERRPGFEAYPDPVRPHELVVRAFNVNGRRDPGLVIFDPFPRKETPPVMPEAQPEVSSSIGAYMQQFADSVWELLELHRLALLDLKERVEKLEAR
jgi:hypothetical protein